VNNFQVENGLGEDRIHYTIDLISPPVAPTIRDLSLDSYHLIALTYFYLRSVKNSIPILILHNRSNFTPCSPHYQGPVTRLISPYSTHLFLPKISKKQYPYINTAQ
jgi:hypothetical protein